MSGQTRMELAPSVDARRAAGLSAGALADRAGVSRDLAVGLLDGSRQAPEGKRGSTPRRWGWILMWPRPPDGMSNWCHG
jgi:hypothetical protein